MPSKRFAIDFKLPCRVSAPRSRYRDRCNPCLPRCAPGLRLRSRPCHATAMRSCLRHRPPMQSKTVALAPLPSSVGCLRPLPSPSPVQDRSPRPQSKTAVQDRSPRPLPSPSPPMPSSAPGLRLRSMPCHACSDAQLPSPSPPMQSCSLPAMAISRYPPSPARSRPWPCHATAMRSCLRHRHRCPMQSKTVAL